MQIVIPMAGRGKRFEEAGYKKPKPLIDVLGRPMISRVIDNIGLSGKYIFLTLQEHLDRFQLKEDLESFCYPNLASIVPVQGVTEGAACTVLLSLAHLDLEDELIIANSDQLVELQCQDFVHAMRERQADGGIVTFTATEDKWSFARLNEHQEVVEVAEKKPISNIATVGIYYYKKAKFFVEGAQQMISKNIRVNGEFYVAPVFQEMILAGHKIYTHHITTMHGLGTPADLQKYLESFHHSNS